MSKSLRTFLIVIIASLMSMSLSKTDIHIIYRLLISVSVIYFVLWGAELVIKKTKHFKRFTPWNKLEKAELTLISGGISDRDKESIIDVVSTVGSLAGGAIGNAVGGSFGGAVGAEAGRRVGAAAGRDMINNPERWEHPEVSKPWDPRDRDKSDKNNSRVICTHFYQKGMLSCELWRNA